ncbi:MAG: DUF4382 domain-containing protein [Gammaproteobacteria bacterium]
MPHRRLFHYGDPVACGGGGGGSDGASTGTLNLAITDASVDAAKAVVIEFTGVELQHAGGERIDYDFVDGSGYPEPRQIDLLALTGGTTEVLLEDVTLTAGDYSWIRLKVNAERGVIDSYIDLLDDSRYSLYVPSGANSGLKLNRGFSVPEGGMASFTIDFDLRTSVHDPSGNKDDYILRPTLRLVDGNTDGALSGTVTGIVNDPDCSDNVESIGAVYVFEVADVVDDLDGTGDPVTSAMVPNDGNNAYTVAFLPEGDYTVAFTCDSDIDDNAMDADTDPTDGPVDFVGEATVTITAGKTTMHDFQIPVP